MREWVGERKRERGRLLKREREREREREGEREEWERQRERERDEWERQKDEESMRIGKKRESPWKTDAPKLYACNECEHSVYAIICRPRVLKQKLFDFRKGLHSVHWRWKYSLIWVKRTLINNLT